MLAHSTAGRCGSPAPTTITGRPVWLISWQAAQRAETSSAPRSCISSMKIATPLPTSAARPPMSVSSSTRSISMSPESARPLTAGASMPGLPPVAQLGAGSRVALGEGLDDAEHLVDVVALRGGPSSRTATCSAAHSGRRSALVGARLELAGAPVGAHGGRAQRVEQHRLADAAQAGQHDGALRSALRDAFEHDVEGPQLGVTAGELGRALAGAGGVGVPDRVHDGSVWRLLA